MTPEEQEIIDEKLKVVAFILYKTYLGFIRSV
jgi:hypothetical protein